MVYLMEKVIGKPRHRKWAKDAKSIDFKLWQVNKILGKYRGIFGVGKKSGTGNVGAIWCNSGD